MDKTRRTTRGRNTTKPTTEEVYTSKTQTRPRKTSPARKASPPVRRSSRPRSTVLGAPAPVPTTTSVPSPIKEVDEEVRSTLKPRVNLLKTPSVQTPAARGSPSPIVSGAAAINKTSTTTTSSTYSTYSSSTQKTVEIRSNLADVETSQLADIVRRSASRTLGDDVRNNRADTHTPTVTDGGSRYSRSVSRSVYEDDNFSRTEYSDNEEVDVENDQGDVAIEDDEHYQSFASHNFAKQYSVCRQLPAPREFGGTWGILALSLLVPIFVYYMQWICKGKGVCKPKLANVNALLDLKYLTEQVFNTKVVAVFMAFNFAIFLLSAVLPGRCVRLPYSRISYKFNALPIAIVATIVVGIAEYLKYPVADFVLQHYLQFCLFGILNAFIVAQWAYIRKDRITSSVEQAGQENPYAKTGNFLIDYAQGRQLNPKWFGFIDAKQVFYRINIITTLIFAECFIYKLLHVPFLPQGKEGLNNIVSYYIRHTKYDTPALLAAMLLLFYILDVIIFEHHLISSFELQSEGFGCLLLLRYAVTPYLLSGISKYFFDRPGVEMHCKFTIYTSVILLMFGLGLKRLSSAVKYKYRIDPENPIFFKMESIHTFQGRRLLLGGLWGRLRQPNYTGDILAMLALCIPLLLRFDWPPFVGISLLIIILFHRTQRVNVRNTSRYHSSWVRYCCQVRYCILPKIY